MTKEAILMMIILQFFDISWAKRIIIEIINRLIKNQNNHYNTFSMKETAEFNFQSSQTLTT